MTTLALTLCIICQLFMIAGQLLLKRAMSPGAQALVRGQRLTRLFMGIACLSVWFFLWLGVLQKLPLSQAFPFEGLNPAMMAIGAWLLLKERMAVTSWIGVGLICAGIAIVATGG